MQSDLWNIVEDLMLGVVGDQVEKNEPRLNIRLILEKCISIFETKEF